MKRSPMVLAAALVTWLSHPSVAQAQDDGDPMKLSEDASLFMEKGQWQEALDLLNKINLNTMRPETSYTGIIFFRKGYCYKMLGKLDEAMKEYQICFNLYKNPPGISPHLKNPVWELAILEMGSLHQMKGNYQEALNHYHRFLALKPEANFDSTSLQIQTAICHAKAGDIPKAHAIFEKLFQPNNVDKISRMLAWHAFSSLIPTQQALPKPKAEAPITESLDIKISADGSIQVWSRTIESADAPKELPKLCAEIKRWKDQTEATGAVSSVNVSAEGPSQYLRFVDVMKVLSKCEISNVTLTKFNKE